MVHLLLFAAATSQTRAAIFLQYNVLSARNTGTTYRSECKEDDSQNLIDAARSRIKDIGGPPIAAAAQVLYELVMEENDYHSQLEIKQSRAENEVCGVFETLLSSDTHTNNTSDSDFKEDNFNDEVHDIKRCIFNCQTENNQSSSAWHKSSQRTR